MSGRYPPPPTWARDIATVGVTGTNGKTTTTTLLRAALASTFAPVAAITTVGTFVGDQRHGPVSGHREFLRRMEALHVAGGRALALELTSASLAAGFMAGWPVRVGVFTNLSPDHDDQHESPEHYLASKAQLFVHLSPGGTAVLNASDPASALLREVIPAGVTVQSYASPWRGDAAAADLVLSSPHVTRQGSSAALEGPVADALDVSRLEVRACGLPFLENAAAALLGAVAMGVEPRVARRALAVAPSPPGRFQFLEEGGSAPASGAAPDVVVDYAHTPDALLRTVTTAKALCEGRLWLVFGAGGDRSQTKRAPLGVAARGADQIVLTSDNPRTEDPLAIIEMVRAGIGDHPGVRVEPDRGRAIEWAVGSAEPGDLVLIAGKGHEREQNVGDRVVSFSDREVAAAALSRRPAR